MKANKLTKETILSLGIEEKNYPNFSVGDTIKITLKVIENGKERLQDLSGVVLGEKGTSISKTFRIKKMSDGVSVERILPYYSPSIKEIQIVKSGKVRRAKLYYLRNRTGKAAEIKQDLKKK